MDLLHPTLVMPEPLPCAMLPKEKLEMRNDDGDQTRAYYNTDVYRYNGALVTYDVQRTAFLAMDNIYRSALEAAAKNEPDFHAIFLQTQEIGTSDTMSGEEYYHRINGHRDIVKQPYDMYGRVDNSLRPEHLAAAHASALAIGDVVTDFMRRYASLTELSLRAKGMKRDMHDALRQVAKLRNDHAQSLCEARDTLMHCYESCKETEDRLSQEKSGEMQE